MATSSCPQPRAHRPPAAPQAHVGRPSPRHARTPHARPRREAQWVRDLGSLLLGTVASPSSPTRMRKSAVACAELLAGCTGTTVQALAAAFLDRHGREAITRRCAMRSAGVEGNACRGRPRGLPRHALRVRAWLALHGLPER